MPPKRRVTTGSDNPPPTPQSEPPHKRTKRKETNGDDVEMVDDQKNVNLDEPSQAPENSSKFARDSDYYFEDGNIIFCVDNTLFKVHKSLLKLQSKNFEKTFGLPSATTPVGSIDPSGVCDENPIPIPDALHREFCNLMKSIYHPFSHREWLGAPSASLNGGGPARRFGFYLDIVRMARRFAMEDIEQWVRHRLARLLRNYGKLIADGIDDAFGMEDSSQDSSDEAPGVNEGEGEDGEGKVGDEDKDRDKDNDKDKGKNDDKDKNKDSEDDDDDDEDEAEDEDDRDDGDDEETWSANDYYAFRFVQAIAYAKDISNTAMLNDSLSTLQYYCTAMGDNLELFVNFLRIPELQESNPALFGSLFLLLLSKGNQQWSHHLFTHMDRMAFFSAQSYLTLLPSSLKVALNALLFTQPDSVQTFAGMLSDKPNYALCPTRAICLNTAFLHWQTCFDQSYYEGVNSGEFLISVKTLTTLSSRRLNFSGQILHIKCQQQCRKTILLQLDEAIQDIHTKLAGYYNGFD